MESLEALLELLTPLARLGRPALAAIDGRCGSGKSTLAGLAAHRLGCPLFHMDDFFLPPALRTPERYAAPGGNVHYERVEAELLRPLRETGAACFRPFDCRSMDFSAPIRAELTGLALVEGSYALHPALRGWYDRTVFLTCSPASSGFAFWPVRARSAPRLLERWIPLEEAYFQSTGLPGGCDLVLDTTP
ncbi:MAG: uridine kinase [Flavonifractor plautii]